MSEILKCHWSSLQSGYFSPFSQRLLSKVRQNLVADLGVKFKFLPYLLFHSIHLQLRLAGGGGWCLPCHLGVYKWNKLSEWAQVEPTGVCKSELAEKPNKSTHKQTNRTKNNRKSFKMIESSLGGVGDATSPGVLREDPALQLAVRVCLSLDNAAGAMGALVLLCWHSAVSVFSIWSTGDCWCPCGGSTACLQEDREGK